MVWSKRVVLLSGLVMAVVMGPAFAACPYLTTPQALTTATVVFSGEVITLEPLYSAMIATFRVDRVWKGTVPAEIVLYQIHTAESVPLAEGARYVIFGMPANPAAFPDEAYSSAPARIQADKR